MRKNWEAEVITIYKLCASIVLEIEANLDKYAEIGLGDELNSLLIQLEETIYKLKG